VRRWRYETHHRQWSGRAVATEGREYSRVDVGVGLAFDLSLYRLRLRRRERRQRKQKAARCQGNPFHRGNSGRLSTVAVTPIGRVASVPDLEQSLQLLNGFLVLLAISTARKNNATNIVDTKNPATAPKIEIPLGPDSDAKAPPSEGRAVDSQSCPANAPAIVETTMNSSARICATKITARRTKTMAVSFVPCGRTITPNA
jgi:hypothetical protein